MFFFFRFDLVEKEFPYIREENRSIFWELYLVELFRIFFFLSSETFVKKFVSISPLFKNLFPFHNLNMKKFHTAEKRAAEN